MNYSLPNPDLPRKRWIDRVQAVFEVLLISGVISSLLAGLILYAFLGKAPVDPLKNAVLFSIFILLESGIAFLFLATILKCHRETIFGLGLKHNRWKPHILIGLSLVPPLFLINAAVAVTFKLYFPKYYNELNPLTDLIHTPRQLILIIFSALIAGGIKEELQRAFILTRFREYLGGAGLGLVLWSIAFGVGHYVQGIQGVLIATIYGLIFGIVYILSRSLIAPIIAHSIYDTIALLTYWFLYGRFR
ncbi:MAG: CPBP family intramembrane metalloprotease [Acidobacteria bacterium]|nr:CPBP family intramembrane metalloprotease [Acidobacteriota bacterium]